MVQLYHISDVGTEEYPLEYRPRWDIEAYVGEDGTTRVQRADRGPIFNRDGGTVPDWDPIFKKPVYVANFDDFDVPIERVLDGSILRLLEHWLTPIERRVRESAREKGRQLDRDADAMAGEMTDYLWREAQKSDAASSPMAYKHAKEELAAWDRMNSQARQLPDYYMPPERR
jgi:hypothetical protein